jgi:hypothetical protein
MLGFLGAIAGLSSVLGFIGQQQTNKANRQIAADTNAFNAEEAATNRAWQEVQNQKAMDFSQYNADTSYRRGVADMRAAGINPILAAGNGGASAPSGITSAGNAASGVKAEMGNALGAGVSSAMQAAQVVQGLEQAQANIQRTNAETQLVRNQTATEAVRPEQIQALTQLTQNQALTEGERQMVERMRINLVQAQTGQAATAARLNVQQSWESAARETTHRQEIERFNNYGPRGAIPDAAASAEAAARRAARALSNPATAAERFQSWLVPYGGSTAPRR